MELPLVLGSGSPRRRELLDARRHRVRSAAGGHRRESPRSGEAPAALALRLAREKARAVATRVGAPPRRLVLGADTIVVIDGDVLGKPADAEDAVRLLARLVGREHRVLTAVAVVASDRSAARRPASSRAA